MRLSAFVIALVVLIAQAGLRAQTFELTTEFCSVPAGVIAGRPGNRVLFTGTMFLTSSGIPDDDGPKGWTIGVKNEGVDIVDVTTVGTDAAALFDQSFFEVTEVIDPARNDGTQGFVSAVVISLIQNITLPPNTKRSVAVATYEATVGKEESQALIAFVDALRGSGKPVENVITHLGRSRIPSLGERTLAIRHGSARVPPYSGDLNGDSREDMSDALYLLNFLFLGGPEPAPIFRELPATGQTFCYDAGGNRVDCDAPCGPPGQDGSYQAGCAGCRFVDNGDGTVTDACTGLMWQQRTADIDGDGNMNTSDLQNWEAALVYCDRLVLCNDDTWLSVDDCTAEVRRDLIARHGGAKYDDWRLPNVRELQSIVDYGRFGPAIHPAFRVQPDWFWSSTSLPTALERAWGVHFYAGVVNPDTKNMGRYVRAVRTIQARK